jgi:hypothetical protein
MNVTILSVDIKTVPTAKGSYQVADVAYKNNTFQGKVEGKKCMSFGAAAPSFKVLQSAQSGETYEVEIVKSAAGYNDWVGMTKANVGAASPQAALATGGTINKGATSTPVRSTYASPEERAATQIYIVRQSSLSNAVNLLAIGTKTPVKPEEAIAVAKQFADFVLGIASKGPTGFGDLPDFPSDEFPQVE